MISFLQGLNGNDHTHQLLYEMQPQYSRSSFSPIIVRNVAVKQHTCTVISAVICQQGKPPVIICKCKVDLITDKVVINIENYQQNIERKFLGMKDRTLKLSCT